MPNRPVVALDVSVLLGLAWLDVLDGNPMFLSPFSQRFTDVFGALVDPDRARFSAPFDDVIEAAYHPLGAQSDRRKRLRRCP